MHSEPIKMDPSNPKFASFYVREPDGNYRLRTSAERESYRRDEAKAKNLAAQIVMKLSDDGKPRNHFRERADEHRRQAESYFSTPGEKEAAKRKAATFDKLADQRDDEFAKADRQKQRETDPAYVNMQENARSLENSFEFLYPHSAHQPELRDKAVAISRADLDVGKATEAYWQVIRQLEAAEADATRLAATEAREQALKAERDALAAELKAAKQQHKADEAGNE